MRKLTLSTAGSLSLSLLLALACSGGGASRQATFDNNPGATSSGTSGSGSGNGASSGTSGSFGGTMDTPADDGGAAVCASKVVTSALSPVFIEFLIDRSGSMGSNSKWTSLVSALNQIFTQMGGANDQNLGVGLTLFPADSNSSSASAYPGAKDVPIRQVSAAQAAALKARISGSPTGGTPTFPAMTGAFKALDNLVTTAPLPDVSKGKRVLVLLTDGDPDTAGDDYVGLTKAEFAKGISTFVIGVGTKGGAYPIDPVWLSSIAQAGGTAKPNCNPNEATDTTKMCQFQIVPGAQSQDALRDEFIAAITAIRQEASGCIYELEQNAFADPTQATVDITVTENGAATDNPIPKDATNGWTFDNEANPTQVILHGTACDLTVSSLQVQVDIRQGCYGRTN